VKRVVHLELHTSDLAGAQSFYGELCGWEPDELRTRFGTYHAVKLGSTGGGIVQCATTHPLWLPYVEVERIGDSTERARELGGRVLLEPREGPSGWRSVVANPAAGELALWQPKR
jgi:predicted enzyme related to lactoylglutathione lyase